ncbi:tetratricopeptide repeat protein, partial [Acidobacteria bacterium AH-259-L09]|nr:tetratricopeptide repeat protein [Acidobacteria bacterium AH-259-L09]
LQDQIPQTASNEYWAGQVEIQRNSALAWLRFAQGRTAEGLELMQSAAKMEAATHKHPVTPGEVLPARELLADLLLELGKPEEALTHYELSLERSPRRFNSLYGAGHAAELMGNEESARSYYRELVELSFGAKPGRERLTRAREYLQRN